MTYFPPPSADNEDGRRSEVHSTDTNRTSEVPMPGVQQSDRDTNEREQSGDQPQSV